MKKFRLVLVMILIVVFAAAGGAWAVGYERYPVHPSAKRVSQKKAKNCTSLEKALSEATFWDKYPQWLDQAAFAVKDVLSQFGIVDKKTP